ncbi:MAG: phosphatidate cytidylyltransferase [Anaerolineaceae bacterium]|nr:phosphatidate cytidylyltransferase [Anaerolineaceae bacterium]MBN2676740.1 phosphatidate cytidylyltransferase [Anaerolineaceae bacterium]
MFTSNWFSLIITFCITQVWLRTVNFIAMRGWIDSIQSRKIIHIGTGPIFVLCWLLFNEGVEARWLAALVPLLITLQFLLVGTGVINDEGSVKAMSRTGDRREILHGPLMYGIVFVVLSLVFWRTSPIGITALMILCVGDGLADVIGSRVRNNAKLPWSPCKTWVGSLAMFLGGWVVSILILIIFKTTGTIQHGIVALIWGSGIVALFSAVIESLPFSDVDNLTVPLAAISIGYFAF